MLTSVFLKTLRDQLRALAGWAVAIAVLVAMYAAIWPSIRDQPSMNAFLDQMPEALRSLFAMSGADMTTPTGYIKIELLSFMGPIVVLLYAIGTGVAAVAGEEDHHTLELLLSTPLSRARIVLEKAGAMAVGTVFLAATMGASLMVEGSWTGMDLPADKVFAAMGHLALLGLVFGGLGLALSAATGRAGLSKGLPAALAVLAYVVNGLGGVVDWLKPVQKYSPLYQYSGHDPLVNGVDWPSAWIALGTAVVLVVLAVVAFRRRDVAV
ncbi:ABC transporter permease subunit [Sinomonas sp. B1-1]|uniref:ABC transporter permease subunit n=1 Tax=Sinomonas sp. B1-1 TaxID=3141454 RepID=UPI003D2B3BA3